MKHRIEDLDTIPHTNLPILGVGTSLHCIEAARLSKRSQIRVHAISRGAASEGEETEIQLNGDKWAKKKWRYSKPSRHNSTVVKEKTWQKETLKPYVMTHRNVRERQEGRSQEKTKRRKDHAVKRRCQDNLTQG
jgi:hypothetical protein